MMVLRWEEDVQAISEWCFFFFFFNENHRQISLLKWRVKITDAAHKA